MLKTIQNNPYTHSSDFDFEGLCQLLTQMQYTAAIKEIKLLASQITTKALLFDSGSYTRNIIINNQHCWLGLLHWDKGASTRIHGHPEHTFVYVVKGRLACDNFDKNPLTKRQGGLLVDGECQHSQGIKGRMDNNIHQIHAKEKSISLHFYSDDPAKGETFDL